MRSISVSFRPISWYRSPGPAIAPEPHLVGLFVGQQNLGRAGFEQHVQDTRPDRIGEALGGEHHGAIGLAQHLEPLADFLPENRMAEHDPSLVEKKQGGGAGQRALEMAEEVEKHRDQVLLSERHQLLDLKDREGGVFDAVGAGVEQMAERPLDGVVGERGPDILILNGRNKIGEAAPHSVLALPH